VTPEDAHGGFKRVVAVKLTGTANRAGRCGGERYGGGRHEAISYRRGKDCSKNLYRSVEKGSRVGAGKIFDEYLTAHTV